MPESNRKQAARYGFVFYSCYKKILVLVKSVLVQFVDLVNLVFQHS